MNEEILAFLTTSYIEERIEIVRLLIIKYTDIIIHEKIRIIIE